MTHTIEFDPGTEQALTRLAASAGKDADQLIREAVSDFLRDQDDADAGDAAYSRYLSGQEKTVSLDDLERRLGLES